MASLYRKIIAPALAGGAFLTSRALPALAQGTGAAAPSLAGIISHTPLWVWAVLAFLIWNSLRRTKERSVDLRGLVLFPAAMVLLFGYNLLSSGFGQPTLIGIAIGALFGIAAGLTLEKRFPPSALGNGHVRLPGEYTSLVVVLAAFVSRYAKTVTAIVDPVLAGSDMFLLCFAGLSGFLAAMLITRTLNRVRVATSGASRLAA